MDTLEEKYKFALAEFLKDPSEGGLSKAYLLGRDALKQGLGLTDIVELFSTAVNAMPAAKRGECLPFLQENLAPFDMSLFGFQEATQRLSELNASLNAEVERRSHELLVAQDRLRQTQKLESIGRLAGGISHDFNNILAVILTYTAVLASELAPDAAVQKDLSEIKAAAQRGAALTKQLLAFSRQQSLDVQSIEVNAAAQQITLLLKRTLAAGIDLVLTPAPASLYVSVGRGQLEQVIMNLVLNAKDALLESGTVTIQVTQCDVEGSRAHELGVLPGRFVCIKVGDNGIGMNSEILPNIFEPFFTTKKPGSGTGLGLPTLLGIVHNNRGGIAVTSVPGEGSEFAVYLPLIDKPAPRLLTHAEPRPQKGTSVLLVEDDIRLRQGLARYLREANLEVYEAQNGAAALEVIAQAQSEISLVISDIMMPVMGGVALFHAVRQTMPEMRFLFISGYMGKDQLPQELGASVLLKPFEPNDLLLKIGQLLES